MADDKIVIHDKAKGEIKISTVDLVYIKQVDVGSVLDVMNLSLDLGYSFTNANNLEQINGDIKADYITNKWGANVFYNTVRSTQTGVDPVKRDNGGFGLMAFAKYGLFISFDADYYSNNEQQMDLRTNYSLSFGKYFIKTNRIFFKSSLGAAYLSENYMDTVPDRKNFEGKVSIEYNMFDVGDLNLYSKIDIFPSITEKGRVRTLFSFDVKYDLPRDFYIKAGLKYNYDNKPAEGIDPKDYVYTFGVGWEL
jgi:hypothetical protein